jgi:hypothetical protein
VSADPRLFDFPAKAVPGTQLDTEIDPKTTLVFELNVKCERAKKKKKTTGTSSTPVAGTFQTPGAAINETVYSSSLTWHPVGDQVLVRASANNHKHFARAHTHTNV